MKFESMMELFGQRVIRHRWVLLGLLALLTGGLIRSANHLVVDNDFDNWLPENDRVSELYRLADKQFSSNAVVFAILDCTEKGVFHPDSLALVERLTDALDDIDDLFNVSSLTNIMDIRKSDYGVEVGDLIPELPESIEEAEALKEYVLSKEMYVDTLVSSEGVYTVVIGNIEGSSDEVSVAARMIETIGEVAGDHPHYFGGVAVLHLYSDRYMNKDLATLVPIMLLVMIVILAISFRRVSGVVLPLSVVVLCILWTFGLMAVLNIYATVFTPAAIVLLTAMGADYSVHFYNHYLKRGDIQLSTVEITVPIVLSALTTIAGLLTFGTTRIVLLQFFGFELGLGLAAACLLSVVLLPICIYLFRARPDPVVYEEGIEETAILRALTHGAVWLHRRAKLTMSTVFICLVFACLGIFRITTNINFLESMPEDSPPRIGGTLLQEHFSGFYPVSIYFQGDMQAPGVLQMENYLENYLRSHELISGLTSINGLIAEENWLMNGVFAVPETREGIANLWLLLEGQGHLRTFVDSGRGQSLVTGLVKKPESDVMRLISTSLREFIENSVGDEVVQIDPARLDLAGRQALQEVQLEEAANQLAWLAQAYDKPRTHSPSLFLEGLQEGLQKIGDTIDLEPMWDATREYLKDETLEPLPEDLINQLMLIVKEDYRRIESKETRARIIETITNSHVMDHEDAIVTGDGVLRRASSALRLQRAAALMRLLVGIQSSKLEREEDFQKRAKGVIWRLWSRHPVFFFHKVASIPGIQSAVIATNQVRIDQTGTPNLIRRFDDLLYISLFQSIVLASVVVLILVSLTQRSFRRGLISLSSVLTPMVMILGLMGWFGIALDFGTALFGALIIGLGIDGSIHFLHYFNNLDHRGIRGEQAVRATVAHVGRAILTANATTCCGFLVLIFSSMTALRNFAIVNSVAIILVTVSLLSLLPVLVSFLQKKEHG
jgi:hypothetical protein